MAKTATASKAPVSQEIIDACLARTVAEGDIVNFRFLFISYSPLRADSSEDIEASKYTYLRPANTDSAAYRELGRAQITGVNWCNPAFANGVLYLRDGLKRDGTWRAVELAQ